jgi:thiamine-monophosphate kinase
VTSEFELIRRYFSPPTRHTLLAGGDDAALVTVAAGRALAVSTDMLVSGRHFFVDADAVGVGHKSLAVNLSDMAAMGALPRWVTLSVALPDVDEAWVGAFMQGFLALADEHDVDLIGGDTTRGPLTICVQVMGEVPADDALRRDAASPGDDLWVSGTVGDAALALAAHRGEIALDAAQRTRVRTRLDRPTPRVALGRALAGHAKACIDISDGLVADVGHICERSGVRAAVDWARVPLSAVASSRRDQPVVRRAALSGGDDYELAFTALPDARDEIEAVGARVGVPVTRIGRMEAGQGVQVQDESGREIELAGGGFDHFG